MEDKKVLGNVYAVKVRKFDERKHEYNYRVGENVIQDPYARRISGRKEFGVSVPNEDGHQIRCGFACTDYDWNEDQSPKIPYEEGILYELHVRGFTKHSASKVRHKGTFRGICEKAEYLKELGINQIKLMPAYEFDEIIKPHAGMQADYREPLEKKNDKINFWGYGTGYYFAPKTSYASTDDPVKEMKDMVRLFHQNGMEVLMEFYFPKEITSSMATEVLLYWVMEYHIDGFQIMGNDALLSNLAKEPMLADTKLIGVYFAPEEIGFDIKNPPIYRNLGEFNDGYMQDVRRFLKGDEKKGIPFANRLRRNPAHSGVINYITKHDGFTLMDLVSYNEKHNEANGENNQDGSYENFSWNYGQEGPTRKRKILELRNRQMRNAMLMLLLSAGTPMLRSGDEIGNSQEGNNNPYCLDQEISWIDWKGARKNAEFTGFIRQMIAFRKAHKVLHLPKEATLTDTLSCGYPQISYHGSQAWYGGFEENNKKLGVMYCGEYAGEDYFLYVAYNLHWEEQSFGLPNLPEDMKWYRVLDTVKGIYEEEQLLEEQKLFQSQGYTITVLMGRK